MQSVRRARQSHTSRSQIAPRGLRKLSLETPKSTPTGPKIGPRSPWRVQERPREPPDLPKSVPRAPKERPRAPQERPRAPQGRPRAPQERPRRAPGGLLRRPRELSGPLWRLGCPKKASFERALSRDSFEKRLRGDFQSNFDDFGLLRASVGPHNSSLAAMNLTIGSSASESACSSEGASKKHENLPSGGPQIDPRSSKIAPRTPLGATSGAQVGRKRLFEQSWVDLLGRKGASQRLSRRLGSMLARSGSQSEGPVAGVTRMLYG